MGGGGSAAFGESRASCPVEFEIPLLASFPYLLGGAERVPYGQWSGPCIIVGVTRSRSALCAVLGPVTTCGYDRFPVELSANIAAMRSLRSTAASPSGGAVARAA